MATGSNSDFKNGLSLEYSPGGTKPPPSVGKLEMAIFVRKYFLYIRNSLIRKMTKNHKSLFSSQIQDNFEELHAPPEAYHKL